MTEELVEGTWGEYLKQEFTRIFGGFKMPKLPPPPKLRKKKKEEPGGLRGSNFTTTKNGMKVYDEWGGRGRVVEVNGTFIAQVVEGRKWRCVDETGKYLWDYAADTMRWCQIPTLDKAKSLVRHRILMMDSNL